jgi:hypothetical protein
MILKKSKKIITICYLIILFIALSGCSRYAPTTPVPPKIRTMDIVLTTAAPVSDNIYYYIVFDTSNPLSEQGPLANLSGVERGKNWSYYIRLYNREFTEQVITTPQSIDDQPVLFDFHSPRYYDAYFSSDTIRVRLNLDSITPSNNPIAFNFITSDAPLNPSTVVDVLDYLIQPRVSFTPLVGSNTYDAQFPISSSNAVSDQRYLSADIISWSIDVYDR